MVVAFDADDTLWHSEIHFERTQEAFRRIVGRRAPAGTDLDAGLAAVEIRNLVRYGYGIKGFTLSMLEAAIELTDRTITTDELAELLAAGRDMLDHPVELLDGVAETLDTLASDGYRLVLVTKGDLHHQQHKIAASGLAPFFERLEIVAEKDAETYRRVAGLLGIEPAQMLMVGNSLRSDVLPALEAGALAVHVPYPFTWVHEVIEATEPVVELDGIGELPDWLADHRARR